MGSDFISVRIALLTVSDTRLEKDDESGNLLADLIKRDGHEVVDRSVVLDDQNLIQNSVRKWIADQTVQVIISTGGTGLTARDVTPEAFEELYDKKIEGFGELFRMISYNHVGTSTMQSRATAGIANKTYLFALPGSPNACRDGWDYILKYQLDSRHKPCNLIQLLPRL
ncbi:MAG: molybdenum cofactor biosynthesis protein B [Alphaproteobacteria bacterium]|nr:molybdenum cofactor biosynthesis protein B [Alphaproteobacteria bacterium]